MHQGAGILTAARNLIGLPPTKAYMRRLLLLGALTSASTIAACSHTRGADPNPREVETIARPLEVYQQLGMLAGPPEFAAVARMATLAGPGDSTFLMINMSMPNSAVRFQRTEAGFAADYRVDVVVLRDTQQVRQVVRNETVRVGSFAETGRTEESILFQDFFALQPGKYIVRLQVADQNSSRGFRGVDTVDVPAYPRDAKLATPLIVYQAAGREHVNERPAVIANARNTVPYGTGTPHVYLELYGAAEAHPVSLRVVDDAGATLWSAQATLSGDQELRHGLVDVPAEALPIGRFWLEATASPGMKPLRLPLLITISDQWMVANFDEVLRFLDYVASPVELDSLKKATGALRRDMWERFWAKRDPLPATPVNEFREQFFDRVRIATEQFNESGRPGWETDRGEVYIVLGPPDNAIEREVGRDVGAQPNFVEWLYDSLPSGRLILQFIDRSGFGRYELTQSSESAFRTVAARMRPRN